MKTILLALLMFAVPMAYASEELWQHDTELNWGKWHFEQRFVNPSDYVHFQLGYDFAQWRNVKFTALYRYIDVGDLTAEHRPYITVQPSWAVGDNGKIKWKNYFEYRMPEHRDDYFRYRTKLTYEHAIGNWRPYVSDRVAFSDEKNGFEGNEAEVGFKYNIGKTAYVGAFYRYATNRDWEEKYQMVGTTIGINF